MSQLDRYIERYGAGAGPKLYHAVRSRSAYIGANARRRAAIARLDPTRVPRTRLPGVESGSERTALLPLNLDD